MNIDLQSAGILLGAIVSMLAIAAGAFKIVQYVIRAETTDHVTKEDLSAVETRVYESLDKQTDQIAAVVKLTVRDELERIEIVSAADELPEDEETNDLPARKTKWQS